MITSPDASTIVTAVIGMGRNLKLRVVAEGVETSEELAFLRAHQCDEGEGYYFGRAMPSDRFATLLETGLSEPVLACFDPGAPIGVSSTRHGTDLRTV